MLTFAGGVQLNHKTQEIEDILIFGPDGTVLNEYLQTLLPQIRKVCEDSIFNMFEKIGSIENEEKKETLKKMKLNEVKLTENTTEKEVVFDKPPAPVMKMTGAQMTIWFPRFIRWVSVSYTHLRAHET